jgi:hypothetical protein
VENLEVEREERMAFQPSFVSAQEQLAMQTSQLRQITYLFPDTTAESRAFFQTIAPLLAQATGAKRESERITLTSTNPALSLPITTLQSAAVPFPQIVFETEEVLGLSIGPLHLRSVGVPDWQTLSSPENTTPERNLVPAAEVCRRLEGHLTRVDHTGVNIPRTLLEPTRWERLLQQLSAVSNLYRYPTGEEWPFLLPATEAEFQDDIRHFVSGREPKFELVYEDGFFQPEFQFALGTDLTRPEVEALFPEPYGRTIPGLEDIFRMVFLAHPYPGLNLRFDVYYRSEGEIADDWETGEWLVKEGGRIR